MKYDPKDLGLKTFKIMAKGEVQCLCPFHNDSSPSATFNTETGLFYCFSCRVGLNIAQFAKRIGIVVPAKKQSIKHGLLNLDEGSWEPRWINASKDCDSEYIASRKVKPQDCIDLLVRENDSEVIFPQMIESESELPLGTLSRTKGKERPKYRFQGKRLPCWPFWLWSKAKNPVLVEGPFSALRLRHFGIEGFAVQSAAIPKASILSLQSHPNAVIFFDQDSAGRGAAISLAVKTGMGVVWPGGKADELPGDQLVEMISKPRKIKELLKEVYGDEQSGWYQL